MCSHLARRCIAREQAFPIHRRKHGPGAPYEQDALSVARTVPPALALSPAEPPRSIMDLMIIRRPRCGHHRPETARHDVNLALMSGLSFCVGCPGNRAVLEHCPHNGRYLYNALCGHHRHAHRLSNPCIGGRKSTGVQPTSYIHTLSLRGADNPFSRYHPLQFCLSTRQ